MEELNIQYHGHNYVGRGSFTEFSIGGFFLKVSSDSYLFWKRIICCSARTPTAEKARREIRVKAIEKKVS